MGALGAVVRLPYFLTTAAAQVMAAVGQTPEWSRAAAFGCPAPGLERALAAAPADAALHMGAVSWELNATESAETAEPAWCGNSYRHDTFQARGLQYRNPEARLPPSGPNEAHRELARLYALGRRFPNDASIRAYQLRRLLRGAVWIPRAEALTPLSLRSPSAPEKPPPSAQLLEQFDSIAQAGQRLEPMNGFFDAMRSVAAFARERDEEALRHLHTAAAKPCWNDHVTVEVRAVWKLLRAAYGDCGIEQLLTTDQFVYVPHFALLRAAARVAVWHGARCERAGDYPRAQWIRSDVMRLGLRIQDQSASIVGKQIGDALFYLAMAPASPKAVSGKSPHSESERRQRRERYAASLEAHGGAVEAAWVRYEGERGDVIHRRIRRAWNGVWDHSSYWPPRGLAVWWEAGVVLVQQLAVVLALWGGVLLLALLVEREGAGASPPTTQVWFTAGPLQVGPWTAACLVLLFAPIVTSIALTGEAFRFWPESAVVGMIMTGLLAAARWVGRLRRRRAGPAVPIPGEAQTPWITPLNALISIVLPQGILLPCCAFISHMTAGGSIFGLPGWGPPLGLTFPELAFLPGMLLGCLALCRSAALGLPVAAGLCRGVRQTAPYAAALLTLLYLATAVPASRANVEAVHQMEQGLSDGLAALEAANYR